MQLIKIFHLETLKHAGASFDSKGRLINPEGVIMLSNEELNLIGEVVTFTEEDCFEGIIYVKDSKWHMYALGIEFEYELYQFL